MLLVLEPLVPVSVSVKILVTPYLYPLTSAVETGFSL